MKKEASGKKGKWLWLILGLVAVLLVVAAVLTFVLIGILNRDKGPADDGLPDLYWNVDREASTDPDTGLSIREPAEDGNYYVRFAFDGEQIEIPVADKKLVNYIDSLDLMGLTLDENGYAVDVLPVADVASVIGEALYVQSVNGDTLIANSSIAMNGRKITVTLNDKTGIYNVSGKGEFVGEAVDISNLNPMDTISIYGTLVPEGSEEEPVVTHVFVLNKPAESAIYFRADQFYDSSKKETTRVPDENGAYTIKWYCNGEIVELKCKDKAMVSTIDSADKHWCHWGLAFDEEGYIVEIIDSFLASRTLMQCERFDITEIYDDGSYVATSLIKNNGAFVQGVVGADCPIYDISSTAKSEGQDNRKVDSLQLGDRVCIWTDTMGNPVHIYVTRRQAVCDAYWVVTRSYNSTTQQTSRTPNEEGYYEIELLKAGDTKNAIYYTKDIELATAIDKPSDRCCGMTVGEGNIIERVYDLEAVFGNGNFVRGYFITETTGSIATYLTPSGSGATKNGVLAVGAKVWNVSTIGQYGAETTLQPGDCVYAAKTPIGEVAYAYVIRRTLNNGADKFYWRIDDRKYDSKAKVTTRVPDADGYYTYLFAHNGQQVTLRTNNKDFATALDYQSSAPAFALEVSGDIITAVHEGTYAYGGSRYNGWTVLDIGENGELYVISSSGSEGTWIYDDDCKIYNVSNSFTSHKGEQIYSIKVGDVLANYRDINGNPKALIVKTRETNKMAFPVAPQTNRQPAEDGWYYIDLAVDGKVRTYKCKNKTVVKKVDEYTSPFGVQISGDEILYMSTTTYVENVKGTGLTTVTVKSVSGSSVTALHTAAAPDKVGTTETITLSSNVKIYDVTPEAKTAGKFGSTTKLKAGDVIRTYRDNDENHLYVYVLARHTREYYGYCDHCQQKVYWTPYITSSGATSYDAHYYLASDVELLAQIRIYSTARDFETVLDLNGHTVTRDGGRAALVRYGDTLTIIDSVGGGQITTRNNTDGGGVIMVSGSTADGRGTVNLFGGTLTVLEGDEESMYSSSGGIVTNSGGIFNMYGGVLKNGIVYGKTSDGSSGGNVRVSSGTFNMYGGTLIGGKAYGGTYQKVVKDPDGNPVIDPATGEKVTETTAAVGHGGNIYAAGKSAVVNLVAGEIVGGYATNRGGNIYLGDGANVVVGKDVKISGGIADDRGGNIYNGAVLTVNGGEISGGQSMSRFGGNIMSTGTSAYIYLNGGKIFGGIAGSEGAGLGGNISMVYSNLVMTGGEVFGGTAGTGDDIYATESGGNACSITIAGGKVAGEVYVSGSLSEVTIAGGTLEGTTSATSVEKIAVSGKPVVKLLKNGNALLELGAMESGANITIDAMGIFTKPCENASAYKSYFHPVNDVLGVEVTANNELKFVHPDAVLGYCEHCEGDADWMPWDGVSGTAGHYFIESDVALVDEITIDGEFVLDLRGHTVTAAENKRAFYVNGALAILDSSESETGTVTGGRATRGGNIYVNGTDAIFALYSGTITNGVADQELTEGTSTTNGRGGNIFSTGTVALFGGTVSNGSAMNGSGYGGNICCTGNEAGVIIAEGAVVTGGNAKSGGNILLMYSNIVMGGGEITASGNGVAIDMSGTEGSGYGSIVIAGGTIADRIYIPKAATAVAIGGNPVIEDLKLGTGTLVIVGELIDGASINLSADGVFTTAFENKADAEAAAPYFHISSSVNEITVTDSNELAVTPIHIETTTEQFYCEHCGATVDFTSWNGYGLTTSGHYFLEGDLALSDVVNIAEGLDIYINLNGYTLTAAEGSNVFDVSGNLSIMDSSDAKTGTVTGGSAYRGGNIYVQKIGSFTLYSGTILGGVADTNLGSGSTGGRGGNIFGNGGTVTLKGGVVSSGSTVSGSNWGGNIFMTGGTLYVEGDAVISGGNATTGGNVYLMYASMVMTGGEIKEGTATNCGGVYLRGSGAGYSHLDISGGYINGKVFTYEAESTVSVSGTAKIENLDIKSLLAVGEMADGAFIKVSGTSGTFTDVLTNANDVVSYFDAYDEAYNVAVSADGKLEIVADGSFVPENPVKELYCHHCDQMVDFTAWDGTAAAGHFYLTEATTYENAVPVNGGMDFVLDLNGETITPNGCRAFYVASGATLSIQDTVGTGVISGGNSNGGRGGNIYASGANVKLYGGSIVGGTATADGNQEGHNVAVYGGEFVMNGNVVIGDADKDGHSLYVINATSVELVKGTVVGKALLRGVTGMTLGSEVNVDLLALRSASFGVIEERNSSEKIAVKITNGEGAFLTGAFTSTLDNAATALTYFEAAGTDFAIIVNAENRLEIVEDTTGGNPGGEPEPEPEPTPTTIYCPHCETEVEWAEWDGTAATGHFYLAEAKTYENAVPVNGGKDFVLDLNGKTITPNGCRAFYVSGGATLSIVDTVGGGAITGGNSNGGRGGNIYATSANVKLYGGSIVGGTATADGDKEGHNVAVYNGVFVMNGNVTIGDADKEGHSLYLFNLTSAELTKGTVVGKAMLRGDTFTAALAADVNIDLLVLRDTKLSAIAERTDKIAVKVSNAAGEYLMGVFTEALDNAAAALNYVKAAGADQAIIANAENKLEIVAGCPCGCGTPVDQVVWLNANEYMLALSQQAELNTVITENVHLKLEADLNITELYAGKKQISIGGPDVEADPENGVEAFTAPDVNVTIDLNGYTWSSNYRIYNYEGCVLTIMDSSDAQTGTMTSTGRNTSAHGGVFANYGTLNILGGTFTQPAGGSLVHKGGVVYQSKGIFNMYGGTITGGHVLDKDSTLGMGGNVHIYNGVFNMYGGTITGGTAGQGGNVYIRDAEGVVFNMYGGNIDNGVATEEADVYVGARATFNQEGGFVGVVVLCPCGCGALAEEVEWLDATEYMTALKDAGTGTITENVHLKLNADLNITELYGAKKQILLGEGANCKVTIDLNGYTWSTTDRLYIYAGNVATIMDSSEAGTGVFTSTGSSGSGRVIINYGTLNLVSGTITMTEEGAANIATGGIVYLSGTSTFNMYGGSIVNGRADGDSGKGGNVFVRNGTTFNMYGGTISGGTANQGSNVYVGTSGTFKHEGGTIEDEANTVYQAV